MDSLLYEVAKAVQEDRLHEAETRRMLKHAEMVRAGFQEKVLTRLGNTLITTGLKVKGQSQTRLPGLKLS